METQSPSCIGTCPLNGHLTGDFHRWLSGLRLVELALGQLAREARYEARAGFDVEPTQSGKGLHHHRSHIQVGSLEVGSFHTASVRIPISPEFLKGVVWETYARLPTRAGLDISDHSGQEPFQLELSRKLLLKF